MKLKISLIFIGFKSKTLLIELIFNFYGPY